MSNFATKKLGPLPTWAWGAIGVGGAVGYKLYAGRGTPVATGTTDAPLQSLGEGNASGDGSSAGGAGGGSMGSPDGGAAPGDGSSGVDAALLDALVASQSASYDLAGGAIGSFGDIAGSAVGSLGDVASTATGALGDVAGAQSDASSAVETGLTQALVDSRTGPRGALGKTGKTGGLTVKLPSLKGAKPTVVAKKPLPHSTGSPGHALSSRPVAIKPQPKKPLAITPKTVYKPAVKKPVVPAHPVAVKKPTSPAPHPAAKPPVKKGK